MRANTPVGGSVFRTPGWIAALVVALSAQPAPGGPGPPCQYDITVVPGWNLIANQCLNGDNTLDTLLPSVPMASVVFKPDNADGSGQFAQYNGLAFGWSTNLTLLPGEGAYFYNPTTNNTTLNFSGTNPPSQLVPLPSTLSLLARSTPNPAGFEDIIADPPSQCTVVYRHIPGRLFWPVGSAANDLTHVFHQGAWHPAPPTARTGEAMWIGPDTTNSGVRSVSAECASGKVTVEFGEVMSPAPALALSNHTIRLGNTVVPITGVAPGTNERTVCLFTAGLMSNAVYTLNISPAVTDLCGNPLLSGPPSAFPGAQVEFLCAGGLVVTQSPTNQNPCDGQTLVLAVGAVSTTPISYRWRKDGADLTDSPRVLGSETSTLTISPVLYTDSGTYTVEVTDTQFVTNLTVTVESKPCLNIRRSGHEVVLSWWTGGSSTLYLQSSTNLPPTWTTVTTNNPHKINLTNAVSAISFFRLSSQQ